MFLERLIAAHTAGRLQFFGDHAPLAECDAFTRHLAPLRKAEWVVYAKRPPELLSKGGGPEAVLAYLSRYTHRVAIANSRLVALDDAGVTFRWKDYRAKGRKRAKLMTLAVDEFIRRFLIHVLPDGFHRIRHYGLLANGGRAENIARARQLLHVPARKSGAGDAHLAGPVRLRAVARRASNVGSPAGSTNMFSKRAAEARREPRGHAPAARDSRTPLRHDQGTHGCDADGVVALSPAQLGMLLVGIDWRMPRRTWRPELAG